VAGRAPRDGGRRLRRYWRVQRPVPVSAPLVREVRLPASHPLVLSVGGTALTASLSTGAYISETAMTRARYRRISGGGFSHLYARPAYQDGVPGTSTTRGVPDVSRCRHGGHPYTLAAGGKTYLIVLIGTSGSAPLWGESWHWLTSTPITTWASSTPPSTASPAAGVLLAFHDVSTGNNTMTFGGSPSPGTRPARRGPGQP
jgi:hypothetical protein